MSSTISQLTCFSSISHNVHVRTRSSPFPSLRPTVLVVGCPGKNVTNASTWGTKTRICYGADRLESNGGSSLQLKPSIEAYVGGNETSEPSHEQISAQQPKRAAKIHDFCFGIPFGGFVLSEGLVGFIFSRNSSTLITGVLFGGALLALGTISLKVWRQGKSSLPFILGQTVLTASLLWKNLRTYSLTKKIFPTGFYTVISAAMLCFYSYVMLSGGNPPSKKKKQSAVISSQ